MSFNAHLYDKLAEDHRQELQHEMEQKRILSSLPHRSMGRRAAGKLGVLLVSLGTRLEKFEHQGKSMAYHVGK